MYVKRLSSSALKRLSLSRLGRCIILTGARQTGKTTLLKKEFRDFEYFSFDEALERAALTGKTSAWWLERGKRFIFDEVQKAPAFFGTVKAIVDDGPPDLKIFLSGSAQIRLMSGIRESLAGRSVSMELFPFVVEELSGSRSRILRTIFQDSTDDQTLHELVNELEQVLPTAPEIYAIRRAEEHLLAFGAMPYLFHLNNHDEKWLWLKEYCNTYLQRDLMDLARINDLDNFVRLERIAALRTGGIVNYSSLARDADISSLTAKKYLNYLEISYHVFLVPAYRAKAKNRLVKSPRLYFADLGIQRVLSGIKLGLTGEQFETFVVAEILKLIRSLSVDVEYFYFRTKDGREVDLLLRTAGGYWAFEVKMSNAVDVSDARHVKGLEQYLDAPLLGSFVIYRGDTMKELLPSVFAVPSWMLWY